MSADGEQFTLVGSHVCDIPIDAERTVIEDWTVGFEPQEAAFVRIVAHVFGEIPSWHRGYGDKSFIFIDEVRVGK